MTSVDKLNNGSWTIRSDAGPAIPLVSGLPDDDFAVLQSDATRQPVLFHVAIPLIQYIQFLRRWLLQILHAADNFNDASPAGTIETAGLHFDTGLLPGIEQQLARVDFGARVCRQYSQAGH